MSRFCDEVILANELTADDDDDEPHRQAFHPTEFNTMQHEYAAC